ncbi:MAG: integrin alpha [Planctomycetota bacterium]
MIRYGTSHSRSWRMLGLLCVALAFSTSAAQAQSSIIFIDSFLGLGPDDHLGVSVAGAGDANGDGFDDMIVGADRSLPFTGPGYAALISGFDNSLLGVYLGDDGDDLFGSSVAGAGDVNGDGFADVIVGAPLDDNNGLDSGSVRVISGLDNTTLYTFDGDGATARFGESVSGAGDVKTVRSQTKFSHFSPSATTGDKGNSRDASEESLEALFN